MAIMCGAQLMMPADPSNTNYVRPTQSYSGIIIGAARIGRAAGDKQHNGARQVLSSVVVSGFQPPRLWEWFVGIDLGVFPRVSVG